MVKLTNWCGLGARLRALLIGACCVVVVSGAHGQTDMSTAPDIIALDIEKTEASLWSAANAGDIDTARAALEMAAMSGDPDAQFHLGRHLLNGWVLPQDKRNGLKYLELSATAENTAALVALGEEFLWGLNGPTNPDRAVKYLEAATALGDVSALRIMGEQRVSGDVLDRDVDRGVALLRDSIAAGHVDAAIALGKLHLYGIGVQQDRDEALALFEKAAEAGNGQGLAAYGDALMWSERDFAQAEALLTRAGDLGASEAWVSLAHGAMYGYLGGGRFSRAKFDGYAEKARKAGEKRIAVLEAERNMWGINTRASGPETLAGLRSAADGGNVVAAGFLIELLRDGNNLNVRRRPEDAQTALEAFGGLFSETRREQYAMSIRAAMAREPEDYAPVADMFNARPELHSTWLGTQIAEANPNIAFYILQQKLRAKGDYDGAINGYATPSTLRAAARACRTLDLNGNCADKVLEPEIVGALLIR